MASERDSILQTAQRYVDKKRYDRAVEEYRKLLAEDPDDARILLKVGDLQTRMKDYAGAVETYERVGAQYASQGFAVKAIAVYKQVRELLTKHAPELSDRYAHITPKLAEIYVQLGLTSDAVSAYDEVATQLQRAGKDREAIGLFRKMVELDGNNPLVHLRLAEALVRTSATDQAIDAFWAAAELLVKLGKADQALKVLERILHFRQDARYAQVAAELYLQRNTKEDGLQALAKLQICFQQDPKNLETLRRLAQAFQVIGSREKAIEVYKEMARIAREQGDQALFAELVADLGQVAPDDEGVKALLALREGAGPSAPPEAPRPRSVPPAPVPRATPGQSSAPPPVRPMQASAPEIVHEEVELLDDDLVEAEESAEVLAPDLHLPAASTPGGAPAEAHAEPSAAFEAGGQAGAEPAEAGLAGPEQLHTEAQLDAGAQVQEVVEAGAGFDASAHARKAIVDSESFRTLGLYSKAVETLSIALEIDPRSIAIREKLVVILSEAGEHELALNESVNVASLYYDEGNLDRSQLLLEGVIQQVPDHPAASELLQRVYYYQQQGFDQSAYYGYSDQQPYDQQPYDQQPYDQQAQGFDPNAQQGYDPNAPLPSYDLEEVSPSRVLGRGSAASLEAIDDPFGDAPLPSFPLGPDGETSAQPTGSSEAVEEVLEEAEFFAARGLYDDARAILEEQLRRTPGHPLLVERISEVNEQQATGGIDTDASMDAGGNLPVSSAEAGADSGQLPPEFDDGTFDLAASLDPVEETAGSGRSSNASFSSFSQEVDVDQVFEKFKEGVRAQVSESDSSTHYDLGVAYKEMGLLADAVGEFELAARDPKRQCMCCSMIGMIELQQNHTDAAIEAYKRGLMADLKAPDQEVSLSYDLAHAYELSGATDQALQWFKRVEKQDANYRDVKERIVALTGDQAASGARAINEDDEFDSIFDELFETN